MDTRTKHLQKNHLIADVNLNPRFEVVQDLFKVSSPGSSQVAGIAVRLEKTGSKMPGRERETKRRRERGVMCGHAVSTPGGRLAHLPDKTQSLSQTPTVILR